MMNLYLTKPESVVNANDSFFNKYTFGKLDYNQAKNIIMHIDGVELTKDFKIKSQFTAGELDLSKLSTGCKTILNIVTYPDKIFNAIECGLNALNVIYRISIGNMYTKELLTSITENIECDILVKSEKEQKNFKDTKSMRNWYIGEYKNEDKTCNHE